MKDRTERRTKREQQNLDVVAFESTKFDNEQTRTMKLRSSVLSTGMALLGTPHRSAAANPSSGITSFVPPTPNRRRRGPSTPNFVTPLAASPPKKKRPRKQASPSSVSAPRTTSFGAITHANYVTHGASVDPTAVSVPVHTLILGTHPGVKSFEKQQYFGHPMNAFWWIAGDCLGFRRGQGVTTSGRPYKFASDLRYHGDEFLVENYYDQLEILTRRGFALWDIVHSCQRPGSLDSNISKDIPNEIPEFCSQHAPTLRRIVLANGTSGFKFFQKHFGDWLRSGKLHVLEKGETEESYKQQSVGNNPNELPIFVISALAVSPAAARYSYAEKRDFWEDYVYQPGLRNHREDPACIKDQPL